ncbi:UV radiation resistance protein and autophagy-related subunit 14-domain-containing protein [Blastocladiella britannica]|nr:UV radiation resistance protein and autophagy-related subunit 14-domain-containing protein [Blastocladiella britannica]
MSSTTRRSTRLPPAPISLSSSVSAPSLCVVCSHTLQDIVCSACSQSRIMNVLDAFPDHTHLLSRIAKSRAAAEEALIARTVTDAAVAPATTADLGRLEQLRLRASSLRAHVTERRSATAAQKARLDTISATVAKRAERLRRAQTHADRAVADGIALMAAAPARARRDMRHKQTAIYNARRLIVTELIRTFQLREEPMALNPSRPPAPTLTIIGLAVPVNMDVAGATAIPPEQLNAAFGYTAHLIALLAMYLAVPLPYDLLLRSSATVADLHYRAHRHPLCPYIPMPSFAVDLAGAGPENLFPMHVDHAEGAERTALGLAILYQQAAHLAATIGIVISPSGKRPPPPPTTAPPLLANGQQDSHSLDKLDVLRLLHAVATRVVAHPPEMDSSAKGLLQPKATFLQRLHVGQPSTAPPQIDQVLARIRTSMLQHETDAGFKFVANPIKNVKTGGASTSSASSSFTSIDGQQRIVGGAAARPGSRGSRESLSSMGMSGSTLRAERVRMRDDLRAGFTGGSLFPHGLDYDVGDAGDDGDSDGSDDDESVASAPTSTRGGSRHHRGNVSSSSLSRRGGGDADSLSFSQASMFNMDESVARLGSCAPVRGSIPRALRGMHAGLAGGSDYGPLPRMLHRPSNGDADEPAAEDADPDRTITQASFNHRHLSVRPAPTLFGPGVAGGRSSSSTILPRPTGPPIPTADLRPPPPPPSTRPAASLPPHISVPPQTADSRDTLLAVATAAALAAGDSEWEELDSTHPPLQSAALLDLSDEAMMMDAAPAVTASVAQLAYSTRGGLSSSGTPGGDDRSVPFSEDEWDYTVLPGDDSSDETALSTRFGLTEAGAPPGSDQQRQQQQPSLAVAAAAATAVASNAQPLLSSVWTIGKLVYGTSVSLARAAADAAAIASGSGVVGGTATMASMEDPVGSSPTPPLRSHRPPPPPQPAPAIPRIVVRQAGALGLGTDHQYGSNSATRPAPSSSATTTGRASRSSNLTRSTL